VESISLTSRPWDVYDMLSDAQFKLYAQAGIEAIHAQLLHNRGITTPGAMRSFLDARYDQTPGPLTLIDMSKALEHTARTCSTRAYNGLW